MLPLYSPYVLCFFKNKFGGIESFAPLQAAFMRNIWKSRTGWKNLLDKYMRFLIFQLKNSSAKIQNKVL